MKKSRDPYAGKKQFGDMTNDRVDAMLEKKRQRSWIRVWWHDNSVLVMIVAIVVGIILLAKSTL